MQSPPASSTTSSRTQNGTAGDGVSLQGWLDKKIVFVSGKGGVGKSLIAAAVATEAAKAGRRTLLVELGDASYFETFWGLKDVGHEPRRMPAGFDLAMWSGETCLREYVLHYLKLDRLYSVFFENKVMRSLINVAPGLSEIAISGKITSGVRKVGPVLDYDLIVVDAYATGHALALLRAPQGMRDAIPFGPMGSHSRDIGEVLRDPKLCAYLTVTLLEELPVSETIEFAAALKSDVGVSTTIVANKAAMSSVDDAGLERAAESGGDVGEFARYIRAVRARQGECERMLRDAGLPPAIVPMVYSEDPNELVERAGEALRNAR